jgi:hypothetical protein
MSTIDEQVKEILGKNCLLGHKLVHIRKDVRSNRWVSTFKNQFTGKSIVSIGFFPIYCAFMLDKLLSVYVCAEISFKSGVINDASTRDGQYTHTTIHVAVNT